MASASMMRSTLQRLLDEKRDHYKQGKEHFDTISEQLKTLNDDDDDDEQKQKTSYGACYRASKPERRS